MIAFRVVPEDHSKGKMEIAELWESSRFLGLMLHFDFCLMTRISSHPGRLLEHPSLYHFTLALVLLADGLVTRLINKEGNIT